jgi:hypothetical protein
MTTGARRPGRSTRIDYSFAPDILRAIDSWAAKLVMLDHHKARLKADRLCLPLRPSVRTDMWDPARLAWGFPASSSACGAGRVCRTTRHRAWRYPEAPAFSRYEHGAA